MKKAVFIVLGLGLGVLMLTGASSCSNVTGGGGNASGATEIEFVVTGSAPNGADITYGSDSSNYQGHLPMDVTKTIDTNVMYYDVTAQLNGGGQVTCKVLIGDGTKIDVQKVGHASGGYNICSAQLNNINGDWG